jgi:riboflavin kinase/FMN adenylyltransferase
MQHIQTLDGIQIENAWLTIGSFDGLHRGHQAIVEQLTTGAHQAGALAVVLTFHPHPSVVLGKRLSAQYLTTPDERAELLAALGVDLLVTHPFTPEVASRSARDFLRYLQRHLGFQELWVGHDFAMGRNRDGDVGRLKELGADLGYRLHVLAPVEIDGQVVSSSRIRALIAEGEVAAASRLLGRPYRLSGLVVAGQRRGRQLGIPTANLAIEEERVLPARGVYVCTARNESGSWGAVANVGLRPTFEDQPPRPLVEAHLLNYAGDLYQRHLQLDFLAHLRGERRFPNPQALVEQIQADIVQARQILAGRS